MFCQCAQEVDITNYLKKQTFRNWRISRINIEIQNKFRDSTLSVFFILTRSIFSFMEQIKEKVIKVLHLTQSLILHSNLDPRLLL